MEGLGEKRGEERKTLLGVSYIGEIYRQESGREKNRKKEDGKGKKKDEEKEEKSFVFSKFSSLGYLSQSHVCPPVRLSACPPIRLSACPPVRLSACPPVTPPKKRISTEL